MQYVYEYDVCALIFIIIIAEKFFRARQFPSTCNRIFGWIIIANIVNILSDIASSVIIENAAAVPDWAVFTVNGLFYLINNACPALLVTYVLYMTGLRPKKMRWLAAVYLPLFVFELLLVTNPVTRLVFYVDRAAGVYVRGPLFIYQYLGAFFYFLLTFVLVNVFRSRITKYQHRTIIAFLFILVVAIAIQFLFPSLLLTGMAMTVSITLMYFTLHNPEDMVDYMTGVFNYGALSAYLRNSLMEKKPLYVITLEIEDMHRINKLFGLEAGNSVMRGIGEYLAALCYNPWVFRTFGARLVAVLHTREAYEGVLSALRVRMREPWSVGGISMQVMVTIRHFVSDDPTATPEDILTLLDAAFSDIAGGDKYAMTEMDENCLADINRRAAVEACLRAALEDGRGFMLNFQPLYSPEGDGYTHAEVLLRFSDPVLGRIPPGEFIPIAEQCGLIPKIDDLVMHRTCAFIQRYDIRTLGLRRLNMNLSAAEFMIRDLPERMLSIAGEYGVSPDLLTFEVTETAATVALPSLQSHMKTMRAAGFTFALDDFGTGYANITQVVNLPFSSVKLDRTLLLSAPDTAGALLRSIMEMFARIGIHTVVEGVETREQADYVCGMEPALIQGFYYAKPMPEAEFLQFLLRESGRSF